MWKFKMMRDTDLESLLDQQPKSPNPAAFGRSLDGICRPRTPQPDAKGRELLARAQRGLEVRQQEELAELLYQGCLVGMMALPLSITQVCWSSVAPDHRQQIARRARRELGRGHNPGLVRDVLQGLAAQTDQFVADPILICKASFGVHFHFGAHILLILVLRMYRRHAEALEALDVLESQALSLPQRAMCMSNRGFILFCTERKPESHVAYSRAAQMSPEAHYEISVLLNALMCGDEAWALESAARLEQKWNIKGGRTKQAIDALASQMDNPIWEASLQDVERVNQIKRKLRGMPALIADILSTIKVKGVDPATATEEVIEQKAECLEEPPKLTAKPKGKKKA